MSYADLGCYAPAYSGIYEPAESYLITAPTVEPVALGWLKSALEIDHDDNDAQLATWIAAARRRFEGYTARAFVSQVREIRLDRFYDAVRLPYPVHAANAIVSVTYTNDAGADVVVDGAAYRLTEVGSLTGAVLRPAYNTTWPSARLDVEAVRIRYTCGYQLGSGDALLASVPPEIPTAIAHFVGSLMEHRESVADAEVYEVPDHCWSLLGGLKARWF